MTPNNATMSFKSPQKLEKESENFTKTVPFTALQSNIKGQATRKKNYSSRKNSGSSDALTPAPSNTKAILNNTSHFMCKHCDELFTDSEMLAHLGDDLLCPCAATEEISASE